MLRALECEAQLREILPGRCHRENVELVRTLFDAWNRGDFNEGWGLCDPAVVIDRSRSLVDSRVYRGVDELERFWSDWIGTWADARWEIEELIETGDDVVVSAGSTAAAWRAERTSKRTWLS